MTFRWRIRHKLILGFGLVLGVLLLMLAGTLEGLLPSIASIKSIQSKLDEASAAEELVGSVLRLRVPDALNFQSDVNHFRTKAKESKANLSLYQTRLQQTIDRHRDRDNGRREKELIEAIGDRFAILERALQSDEVRVIPSGSTDSLYRESQERIRIALDSLSGATRDLREAINEDIKNRLRDAREAYALSMWIVSSTCVVGTILMLGLLRFFYRWIFYPVRDLELGACRVAQGDFDHRIELHSGDEMEELAAAFNDMTGRLREMYRDLEHQVNERSRQLVRSERLASVGFLAAGVAHEINNPLASIAFCSEALESRVRDMLVQAPDQAETVTKYLRMIQQEAFRCKDITQRLLEFSRGSDRSRGYTDMGEVIQSVLDMVQHLQNYKGRRIVFEPAQTIRAWVNAQEIKSVVLNLVVNALDSMEEGGVLTIELGQRDRLAQLIFRDTGCGMTAEVLENIFEPFFTRSRTGRGTGLGLSISHRVISQHGGDIEATSPGLHQGSTFTVRLPLNPAEPVKEERLERAAA